MTVIRERLGSQVNLDLLYAGNEEAYAEVVRQCIVVVQETVKEAYNATPPVEAFWHQQFENSRLHCMTVRVWLSGIPVTEGVELLGGGSWDGKVLALEEGTDEIHLEEYVQDFRSFVGDDKETELVRTGTLTFKSVGVSTVSWRQVFEEQL